MKHPQQTVPNRFTGYGLDRVHHRLQDDAWVTVQLAHPDTRFLPMWRLQPLVVPGNPPRPVWLTPEAAAAFLAQAASLTVLGVAEGHTYATFDLPAPVDPVRTLSPLPKVRTVSSTTARLLILSSRSIFYRGFFNAPSIHPPTSAFHALDRRSYNLLRQRVLSSFRSF